MSSEDADRLDVTPAVLWAVADEWARRAIHSLQEAEQAQIPLDELADQLAREHSESIPAGSRRAKLRLHHSSLPKLDDHGLIEYDRESKVVRNNPEIRLPEDLMNELHALDDD